MKRNLEQNPTFHNGIIDPTATSLLIQMNRESRKRNKEDDAVGATPPPAGKLPREANPPFFAYLTKSQKASYSSERMDETIRKHLYEFTDPEKPTVYLTMLEQIKIRETNETKTSNVKTKAIINARTCQLKNELTLFYAMHAVQSHQNTEETCKSTPTVKGLNFDVIELQMDVDKVGDDEKLMIENSQRLEREKNDRIKIVESYASVVGKVSEGNVDKQAESANVPADDPQIKGGEGSGEKEGKRGKGGKGGKGRSNEKVYTDNSTKQEADPDKATSFTTLTIMIAHLSMDQFDMIHPDIGITPLSDLDPCNYVSPTCYPGKNWFLAALMEVIKAHTAITLVHAGVSLRLSSEIKYDKPPWKFILTYLKGEQNKSLPLTEFLTQNEHKVSFLWKQPSKHPKDTKVYVHFRMTTVTETNRLDDRVSYQIEVPSKNFTTTQSNINDMIMDLNERIGSQFGTPKIIEDPDPNEPDRVFFNEAWVINYVPNKVFDPGSRMSLESNSQYMRFSVLKKMLGDTFDPRFSFPYFTYIAGLDDSTLPSTPKYRKLNVSMVFLISQEKDQTIRSGCRKEGRTFHDEHEKLKKLASGLIFVNKDECPHCNFPIDPMTLKFIYTSSCPVPGCAHIYGDRRKDEKAYLLSFDGHDCEKILHSDSHMKNYKLPVLPDAPQHLQLTAEQLSKKVTISSEFAQWKIHVDRQTTEQLALVELRERMRAHVAVKPVYRTPTPSQTTVFRPGFKRAKRLS